MKSENLIKFLHGTKRFNGQKVEIKESKKGRYESGVGFYLTTSYDTARKYASSTNNVLSIRLQIPKLISINSKLPAIEMLDFIDAQYRMKGKGKLMKEFYDYVDDKNDMRIQCFLNILINNQCLAGKTGVNFAKWIVEKGYDAILEKHSSSEWLILFNPKLVENIEKYQSFEDVPLFAKQIENITQKNELLSDMTLLKKRITKM